MDMIENWISMDQLSRYGAAAAGLLLVLLFMASRLTIRRLRREIEIRQQMEHRLHDSEAKLKEERASLELRVQARTADLARSESQLRATLDNTPNVAIQWFDDAGRVIYWNAAAENLYGWQAEETMGKSLDDFMFSPERMAAFLDMLSQIRSNGRPIGPYESEYRHKTGQIGWLLSTTFMIPIAGNQRGFVRMDVDITERKQAELDLLQSQKKFQRLVDDIGEKFIIYSHAPMTGEILYVSDGITQVMGLTKEAVLGKLWYSLFQWLPDALVQAQTQVMRMAIGKSQFVQYEMEYVHPDGSVRTIQVSSHPVRDETGQVVTIDGIVEDISERKQAEQELERHRYHLEELVNERTIELRRQQTFTEAVLEHISDGIAVCDQHGMLSLFNRASRELFGAELEHLPPESWAEHYRLLQADGVSIMPTGQLPLFRAFQGEQVRNQELLIEHSSGHKHIVLCSGQAMHDKDGQKIGAVVSMHDITLQKKVEADLIQARDKAEAANHAKTVFMANMSHELRTPLNAILGFAQLLERDRRIPDQRRQQVAIINRSGQHLLSLIDDVLEVSRIEQGRTQVSHATFDLASVLDSVEAMVRIRATNKGLAFLVERSSDLPDFVMGDAHHLRQVLINLLYNAVRYTEQGQVRFAVTVSPEQTVRFEVSDTGPGIAEAEQERIFQPFYQINGNATKGEGTGLGLTISREFVRLMGGELTLESIEGKGSTFRFAMPLPAAEAPPQDITGNRVAGLAAGQSAPRILLGEDHPYDQHLIRHLLEQIGCQVAIAANGREVQERFQNWRPQLILMDISSPAMDAYAVIRNIRALPGGDLPIVVLTASALEPDNSQLQAAGYDDIMQKPIQADRLFENIGRLLRLKFEYTAASSETLRPADSTAMAGALAALPAELREELANAAVALDMEAVLVIAERIRSGHPAEADLITELVEGFCFDKLIALSPKTKKNQDE